MTASLTPANMHEIGGNIITGNGAWQPSLNVISKGTSCGSSCVSPLFLTLLFCVHGIVNNKDSPNIGNLGFALNCVNNKMLEYDWFLTAHIYSLILLCNFKTVRFDLSDYQKLVIGQVKSDS